MTQQLNNFDPDALDENQHNIALPIDDTDEFNKAFRDFIGGTLATTPGGTTPDAATGKKPRKYQQAAIDFLTDSERAILADPPGAGKTPESLWTAQANTPPNEAILVITPAHLCAHWYKEIGALYPNDSIINVSGATRSEREHLLSLKARWYIVNTQMFRRDYFVQMIHALTLRPNPDLDAPATAQRSRKVTTIIVDESHYFKNPSAKSSNALYRMINDYHHSNHVPRVYMLSATPIMREADDLYMQLRILDPKRFPGHRQFLNYYCWYEWMGFGPYNVVLRKGVMEKQFKDIILTRSYDEIGLELPPLVSDTIPVEMPSARKKAYDDLKAYWRTQILIDAEGNSIPLDTQSAMELLHLLRYMTNTPEKRQVVTDLLPDNPGPYVIFTFYRKSNNELANDLRKAGYNVTEIHGGVPVDRRASIANNALRTPTHENNYQGAKDVVIATIPSLRDGCNLSQANTVIFYEDDYTPGSNYQALSRVRRHRGNDTEMGSADSQQANSKPVICHHILTKNTIDERVFDMQAGRAAHVKGIMQVEMDS